MAVTYRPEDFFGVPDSIFTNLQLYKYINPQLELKILRKEVTDYFENEHFNNRGFNIAYSHEDGKNVERPFIGPLFEVEMPSGQIYQIIVPCSSPKDWDYTRDNDVPTGLSDKTQYRLLLSDLGLVASSQYGPGKFDILEHQILEVIMPIGMIPVLPDWIETYDISENSKHIWEAPNYFSFGKKNIKTADDYRKVLNTVNNLLPVIQDELINTCIDIFRQGMCLVNTHTFLPLRSGHKVSALSDRELGKLFYTFIDLNNSKQTINDFKKSTIVDLYGSAKLRGLNFTEILMEVEVAKEFLNTLIEFNNLLEGKVVRDANNPEILIGVKKGISVGLEIKKTNNRIIQLEKQLLTSDKTRIKTLEEIKESTRTRHKEKEIQYIASKDDGPNKS